MPDDPEHRIHCPSCGKRLRLPTGATPGKEFRCPRCAARVRTPGVAPGEERKELLPTCPVCARGKVVEEAGADEDLYVCTHCKSRLSETVLGFVFLDIDPRYVHVSPEAKNQPYTRQRLIEMATEAAKSGQSVMGARPAAAPPKAAPPPKPASKPPVPGAAEETPEDKQDTGPVLTGEDLLAEMSAFGKDDDANDADLWWEVDEEEPAKGGDPFPPPPPGAEKKEGGLTVDDILGDIGN